jgi:hypothetical protein
MHFIANPYDHKEIRRASFITHARTHAQTHTRFKLNPLMGLEDLFEQGGLTKKLELKCYWEYRGGG